MTDIVKKEELNDVILRLASDKGFDVEKLEKLIELKKVQEAEEAKKDFYLNFNRLQVEIPKVSKNKRNDHLKASYATLENINDVVMPLLLEYGFSITTSIKEQTESLITVETTLMHVSGHVLKNVLSVPLDGAGAKGGANKTQVQATGSSISYARRYAMCMIFNVRTGDDNDGNAIYITTDNIHAIEDLALRSGADIETICNYYGIDDLKSMRIKQFHETRRRLQHKINVAKESKPVNE